MRQELILSAILFISAAAFAQVTVVSGYATNRTSVPGAYAAPFVPLVNTPSVALETGLPTQVGASNATAGNVAGATSAPVYGTSSHTMDLQATFGPGAPAEAQSGVTGRTAQTGFEFGIARFESSQGVAQLAGSAGKPSQPAREYTNTDVDHLNQATGTVRYGGKTERLE
jgi:hypothetical protein